MKDDWSGRWRYVLERADRNPNDDAALSDLSVLFDAHVAALERGLSKVVPDELSRAAILGVCAAQAIAELSPAMRAPLIENLVASLTGLGSEGYDS